MPIDINTATFEELLAVPGVGPVLAERILEHRRRRGAYARVEDLLAVERISPAVLDRIRGDLVVGTDPTNPEEPEEPEQPEGRPEGGGAAGEETRGTSEEQVEVQVHASAGDGDYAGHVVRLEGLRREELTLDGETAQATELPVVAAAVLTPQGEALLTIPPRSVLVGDVTISVLAPDGAVLTVTRRRGARLPDLVTIGVDPHVFPATVPTTDPAAGKPQRVRGQVIDVAGRRAAAGLQVVLWATTEADPEPADHHALVVATTDGQGHFSGPYPLGTYASAHGTVGVDEAPQSVPVRLVDGEFPESVVLVVDLPRVETDDDCGCHDTTAPPRSPDVADLARADGTFSADAGAGRCVDFTKPDRTLEEYSFGYVVRTTEPEIRGLTLDEPRTVPVKAIRDVFTRGEREARTRELPSRIDASALRALVRSPRALDPETLEKAADLTLHHGLRRVLDATVAEKPGRRRLTAGDPVDWDDDPTVYQAVTIAHGHLLRFKQEWVADGYSMGNLLYSLPLAPGQKKQVAVVDWERRETTAREEARTSSESLEASLQRDRDVSDVVRGTLSESVRGGSTASSQSFAAGLGVGAIGAGIGGLLGVGGGASGSQSSAWQDSSRSTALNALNQLRDRTVQSASSVRSQRTSVVHTVAQGERVTAGTESVANYNHCHAMTVQYFEVLRHLLVRQRLVDVQECLFVPLLMSWFTDTKALRWRSTLAPAVPRDLRRGFEALDRIEAKYVGSDLPVASYAEDQVLALDGELTMRFQLARPRDKNDEFDPSEWNPLLSLVGFSPADFHAQHIRNQQFKDRAFLERLAPRIADAIVGSLQVTAVVADGSDVPLGLDPTLVSPFANDRGLAVTLRMTSDLPALQRVDVRAVKISSRLNVQGSPLISEVLPAGSRVVVDSASMRYRTAHMAAPLFQDARVRNDLSGTDPVRIETPLSRAELRNPRQEDRELSRRLLDHLNENLERYHHVLWAGMSDDRRYMLLDGFEAPNSGGRSVASVVENELIGIVGNSLVMPVARGFQLDPTYRRDAEAPVDLLEHYRPTTPVEPSRVAIPTAGVYAEAVMGACNSCEIIDETRFWRWEESPIPDSPTQLLPVSTDTRRAVPAETTPTEFPAPIIAMQNAPAAPDPTGLASAIGLLGQAGAFRDITGLEGTQKNAAEALQQAFSTATAFGTKAADLALQGKMSKDIDKAVKTIQSAKQAGLISEAQASSLTESAINGMVGAGATTPAKSGTSTKDVEKITRTAGEENASVKVTKPTGEQVAVDARKAEPSEEARATKPAAQRILLALTAGGVAVAGEVPGEEEGETFIPLVSYAEPVPSSSAARPDHLDIVVRKRIDKSTPAIIQAYRTNADVVGRFDFFEGTGPKAFFVTEFSKAAIRSRQQLADPSGVPLEEITFRVGKVIWRHVESGTETVQDLTPEH